MSNNRYFLKQTFQELTLPKVSTPCIQNSSCVPATTSKSLSFFIVIFLDNICNFWAQKHSRNLYNQVCTHTQKLFVRTTIWAHQNPPRIWQNRLKNPLKPIANLQKTVSDTRNDKKRQWKWFCKPEVPYSFQVFFKQNDQKTYSNVELKKTVIFWYLFRYIETSVLHGVPFVSPWVVCLTCWN